MPLINVVVPPPIGRWFHGVPRRPPGVRVLQCPSCGSADIFYEAGGITGQKYKCQRCGYLGAFVIERDLEPEGDRDDPAADDA